MKKIFTVCLGLLLIAGLIYADTADRAPAGATQVDLKKEADVATGTPVAGKGAGGPDAFGYRWIDSNEPGGPTYSWVDITGTGTALNLTDDGEANITLPFAFSYYGVSSSDLRVGNNGGILFGVTAGDVPITNYALPSRYYYLRAILPFSDDLDQDSGNVYWEVQGTTPNRQLIVEWYNRVHYSISGGSTFEVILFEGSNEILYQYADVDFNSASYNYGISATVGIQGDSVAANNWFLQYSFNTASLANNLAIKFYTYTPQAGDLALQSIDVPAGSYMDPNAAFTPTVTVNNPGSSSVSNFQVVFDIDDGTTKALVYTDTVDVAGPLDPGNTVQCLFTDFTPLDLSNYDITAYVSAAGDPYPANDTLHYYFRTFNELQGNVGDDNNGGAPVDAATITATGPATYNTTTDGSGDYFFFDMTAGTYTVTASKTGYLNEVVTGVVVVDEDQTQLDMSMGYPVLALTPTDSIYVTLGWGGMDNTTWQFALENTGTRDMNYSVSWPELNKGGRALGDSLWGLGIDAVTVDNQNLGVEYVDGYLWITGGNNATDPNRLYKIDVSTGTLAASYNQSSAAGWGWRDLAYDGTYLYGSDDATIKQINPATGAATGVSINVPGGINPARALAYNPVNDHFYTANWASNIVEFDRTGAQINSWANVKSAYGMACDPYNPAGPSLWVWSQDGTPASQASRFDLTTGVYGAETFQGSNYDPASMAGGACLTDQMIPGKVALVALSQGTPDAVMAYEIRDNSVPWLDITPNSGTVPAYGTENLAVAFDAAGLDSFTDYAANVTFNTNASVAKRIDYVPAYMHVIGTGVAGGPTRPLVHAFGLSANRPNPVNGRTTFSFTLPKSQDYSLKIYNITGQMVQSFSGKGQAGPNSLAWTTGKNGAGVYFYQLASGGMSATRKLVIVK